MFIASDDQNDRFQSSSSSSGSDTHDLQVSSMIEGENGTNKALVVFPFPLTAVSSRENPIQCIRSLSGSESLCFSQRIFFFPPTRYFLLLRLSMAERQLHRILPLERDLMVCLSLFLYKSKSEQE